MIDIRRVIAILQASPKGMDKNKKNHMLLNPDGSGTSLDPPMFYG